MNRHDFEQARVLYREAGGTVRGFGKEWLNFIKESKSRDWRLLGWTTDNVCPLLKPAIETQIAKREKLKRDGFCPPWKNFKTWINGGWWTEEVPQTGKPKITKCGKCGKPSTHSIFVYFEDGARNVYRCDACPDPEPDWKKRQAQTG